MRVLLPPAEWLSGPGPLVADEVVSSVVTAAVWAPSVHYIQPWRFGACGQEISLHADAGRRLMVADPLGREMMISCEAALFDARLAPRSLGYVPVPPTSYQAREERTFPHFPGRDFAYGRGWGLPRLSPGSVARAAGAVGLLATTEDRPADWVKAGQALQRVLLTSAARGVAAALHSQPLELTWLRELIRTRSGNDAYPQMVLRLGTVIQTSVSVRHPPASVLFAGGIDG